MKHSIHPGVTGNVVAQQDVEIMPGVALVQAREPVCSTAEILSRYRLSTSDAAADDHSYAVVLDVCQ